MNDTIQKSPCHISNFVKLQTISLTKDEDERLSMYFKRFGRKPTKTKLAWPKISYE